MYSLGIDLDTVSNVAKGINYVANCCGCCCGILRGITEFGIDRSVAAVNYYAVIDSAECKGCENCVKRCHMHAISIIDEVAVTDLSKCIGCGLCVSGCPTAAAHLELKPESEIIHPPADFAAWQHERLLRRGMM